ncbi:ArsR/SmtB family transcription factor [Halorussus halophilus]|uniref:ArsR/SmtB family transcription factor n=1 Tax=Halorussus halophilus TaxID=2650975 RepID=UPI00130145E5|nr:winged helix-turn-helix domain-containing protein [Halorussus halophilus]
MLDLRSPRTDRVVDLDDDDADVVLSALSNGSARRILSTLSDGPQTVSELAERTDLTAQNVSYHLGKLTDAELVETRGTRGQHGNEATVYAPAQSVVVSTGSTNERQYRTGIAGLVAGMLLSFLCLHSVVEQPVDPLALVQHGFALLVSLV